MIKDRGQVKAGATMTATYKGTAYECQVSKGEDGDLLYTVADRQFTSITGAARWVVGGCPAEADTPLPHRSGWSFWSIPTEPTPAETTAEAPAKAPKKAKPTA